MIDHPGDIQILRNGAQGGRNPLRAGKICRKIGDGLSGHTAVTDGDLMTI
jgi:hypothetical protein